MTTYKYFYKISYWDEVDEKERTTQGVIFATDSIAALQQLADYFGEENFNKIEIIPRDDSPMTLTSTDWDKYVYEYGDVCWDEECPRSL